MSILTEPKHKDFAAVAKWLLPCIKGFAPILGKFEDEQTTVVPAESEITTQYLDGSCAFWKSYAVQCYFSVAEEPFKIFADADAEDSENISEFELAQSIQEWVREQDRNGNFPIVDGWAVEMVEPTSAMPNFDGVDDSGDTMLARYSIFVRIHYMGVM